MKTNPTILILRNTPHENPGIIENLLTDYNLTFQIVDFEATSVIKSVENFGALIVLGGPESANDLTIKMFNELALIRQAVSAEIPYLGICLGHQMLVKAMGGSVVKCQTPETGFRDPNDKLYRIKLTEEGQMDPLFENLPDYFNVFQLHGETVEITPQMTLLATGEFCQNQIVKAGKRAYGIQSHFELTEELLESWIVEDTDLQKLNADLLRSDFNSIDSDYQKTGRRLFSNFLSLAGLIK